MNFQQDGHKLQYPTKEINIAENTLIEKLSLFWVDNTNHVGKMLKNGNVLFKHQKLIDIILFQKLKDFLIHRFSIFTKSVIMQSFSSTFLDVISPYFERCHNAVLLF